MFGPRHVLTLLIFLAASLCRLVDDVSHILHARFRISIDIWLVSGRASDRICLKHSSTRWGITCKCIFNVSSFMSIFVTCSLQHETFERHAVLWSIAHFKTSACVQYTKRCQVNTKHASFRSFFFSDCFEFFTLFLCMICVVRSIGSFFIFAGYFLLYHHIVLVTPVDWISIRRTVFFFSSSMSMNMIHKFMALPT